MELVEVSPTKPKNRKDFNQADPQIRPISDITRQSRRREPRKELSPELLKEFVKTINSACEKGGLPYHNYRLNQEGSKNKVYAHYMCTDLDPVYLDVAKKLAQRDKITLDEALKDLTLRLIDKRKEGLAFILTNDAKKFWYHVEKKLLYHKAKTMKGRLTDEEKRTIAKLRSLLTPGKESQLLEALKA